MSAFGAAGFVQLTGRSNYLYYGEALGLSTRLIEDPELANDAHTAAAVLACFIKRTVRNDCGMRWPAMI